MSIGSGSGDSLLSALNTLNHGSISGFPPIAAPNARILILGSMPSTASLAAEAYYAHPRNAFWPIMGRLLGFDPAISYAERQQQLIKHRIALWDVAHRCTRPGSLDADIRDVEANDFPAFLASHPHIAKVFFNGAKAEELFLRLVRPSLDDRWSALPCIRLPSTSPAHAALDFEAKLGVWEIIRTALESDPPLPHK